MRVCDALLPSISADFGVSLTTVSAVVLGFSAAYGFTLLLYGAFGDQWENFASSDGAVPRASLPQHPVRWRPRSKLC
jgi:MFS family permease